MQIYAYDENGIEVAASHAVRGAKYYCPECHQSLSFRSSPLMRTHFFHLKDQKTCFHTQKSLTHLEIQEQVVAALPLGEARIERRFKEISRVADVYWEKEKLVFEAQVSFITAEEVEARNKAYRSIGIEVVWLLHRPRYGQHKVTATELHLQDHPHYYSNHTPSGMGFFFDQFGVYIQGKREASLFRRKINFSNPVRTIRYEHLPRPVKLHRKLWKVSFKGDILNSEDFSKDDLQKSIALESIQLKKKATYGVLSRIKRFFRLAGYLILDSI